MKLKDNTRNFKGIFELEIRDSEGNIIEKYVDKNLIVDRAKFNMSQLISASGNNAYIDKIGFGIGTASPDPGDLTLTGSTTFPFDSITYPDATSVCFNWSLGVSDMNGVSITEYGLISHNGDLFSRKTRSAIVKSSDFSLNGKWTILF